MATPSIDNVYPADGSKGIVLSDTIKVTFNQEMDTTSINTGTFVVGGPDNSSIFSPLDVSPFDLPGLTEENKESFPYFSAPVSGTITFKRVDAYGVEIDSSICLGRGRASYSQILMKWEMVYPLEISIYEFYKNLVKISFRYDSIGHLG